jgi:hypothetical protein
MDSLAKTYAVIVAIEEYPRLGTDWSLPGVGEQAVGFAKWLIDERGVPPANLQIFAGMPNSEVFTDLGVPPQQVQEASSQPIDHFFASLRTNWPDGTLLFVYWVGHGFVGRDRTRRLILTDAEQALKINLDVNQLVELLRSDQAGNFTKQMAFIDTCARFFEELQSVGDLPAGRLNPGQPHPTGVEQNFYFAASSGQYGTKDVFGPYVLDLLRALPNEEWPPDRRRVRDAIEKEFDRLEGEARAKQQPAWLEYRDQRDNIATVGVLPTLSEIQNLNLDLMRLIAGVIEQGRIDELVDKIVELEENSYEAFRLARAARSVERVRGFWRLLAKVRLPVTRARSLYMVAHKLRADQHKPSSLEEIVWLLTDLDSEEPLIEFLLRAAQEWSDDVSCESLLRWLDEQTAWAQLLPKVKVRLDRETQGTSQLMVVVGRSQEAWRVTRAWLWPASEDFPSEMEPLDAEGNLTVDIAVLLNEAQYTWGAILLEVLVPEQLLHLERGALAWTNRNETIDPEHLYPMVLRWQERMAAPRREAGYQTGLWKKMGKLINERLGSNRRAYWLERGCKIEDFRKKFDLDQAGELIGIPLSSEDSTRKELIRIICNGGLPFACWPRCAGADLRGAAGSVEALLLQHQFQEIPAAVWRLRGDGDRSLDDILFLWDDPRRNPYDFKYADVSQKG